MEYVITSNGELYHYGVPGMKWGRRKSNPALDRYKTAKKTYRTEIKDARKQYGHGVGIKGIAKANKAIAKADKAEMEFISEKAKYKASKSAKKERNTYVKEMTKSGLPGSAKDNYMRNRSTRLYNSIKAEKGKKYADDIMKKTQNRTVGALAATAAFTVGTMVVTTILSNN